jgi:ankyrin repeat protein
MIFIKESNWRFCSLLLFLLLFVFIPNFGYPGDMRDELLAAIKNGDENSVNAMISKGTDVNAADRAGITPLIYAAKNGRTGCVKTLIENGAYINA